MKIFTKIIDSELQNKTVTIGRFTRNEKIELYNHAPLTLKFQANESQPNKTYKGIHVFICIDKEEFTKEVFNIQIFDDGKSRACVIIFAIALVIVIFITYG
jgi:D-Tyr-tRNAtyr deacylase